MGKNSQKLEEAGQRAVLGARGRRKRGELEIPVGDLVGEKMATPEQSLTASVLFVFFTCSSKGCLAWRES